MKSIKGLSASSRGRKGRSPEFARWMDELKVTDPARHADICKAEGFYVDAAAVQLRADEQTIADQQEGWSDPTGQRGA